MESASNTLQLPKRRSQIRRKSVKIQPTPVTSDDNDTCATPDRLLFNNWSMFNGVQRNSVNSYKNTKRGVHIDVVYGENGDQFHEGMDEGTGLEGASDDFLLTGGSAKEQIVIAGNRTIIQYFSRLGSSKDNAETIDFEFLDELFSIGARPDCYDVHGQTLLHEAVRSWHTDVAKYLIQKGVIVNARDKYGRTPLHVAAKLNYPEMVKLLIKAGADKESQTYGELQTPVHYAAKNDAVDALCMLIKLGCRYKLVRDHRNRTPLYIAAEFDRSESAKYLLEKDAPAGVRDDNDEPAVAWLILNMPIVAKVALDQFHRLDRPGRKQHFHLQHLETRTPEKLTSKKSDRPVAYPRNAITAVTLTESYDLVTHPVIRRLASVKWTLYARRCAIVKVVSHFLFILLWSFQAVFEHRTRLYYYELPKDWWRALIQVIIVLVTLFQIAMEINEFLTAKRSHKKWTLWRKSQIDRDIEFAHPRWPEEKYFLLKQKIISEKKRSSYFKDWWNVFDWICLTMLLASSTVHIFDVFLHTDALSRTTIRLYAVNVICIWLRFMKEFRPFANSGPFIVMLGKMLGDVTKFIFLYLEFYIPFLCAFWILFGGKNVPVYNALGGVWSKSTASNLVNSTVQIEGFETIENLMFSVFRMTLIDDYPWNALFYSDAIMAPIIVATWLAVSGVLCLNIFIAMLSDTFQRVYDNANATAWMQKLLVILRVEEDFLFSRWSKSEDIFTDYAPEVVFYDQETAPDSDVELKKMATKIEDELKHMRSWLHTKLGFDDSDGDDDSDNEKTTNTEVGLKKLTRTVNEAVENTNIIVENMHSEIMSVKGHFVALQTNLNTMANEFKAQNQNLEVMLKKLFKAKKKITIERRFTDGQLKEYDFPPPQSISPPLPPPPPPTPPPPPIFKYTSRPRPPTTVCVEEDSETSYVPRQ